MTFEGGHTYKLRAVESLSLESWSTVYTPRTIWSVLVFAIDCRNPRILTAVLRRHFKAMKKGGDNTMPDNDDFLLELLIARATQHWATLISSFVQPISA
jgi:hypothetical protein